MKSTAETIKEMEKEAKHTLKLVPLTQRKLFVDEMRKHIHSFSRKLIESVAEEIIKTGEQVVDDGAYGDEYCEREDCHFQNGYEVARDCTDMQRLKMKEIIQNLH